MGQSLYRIQFIRIADLTEKEAELLCGALPEVDIPAIERYIPDDLDESEYTDIKSCTPDIVGAIKKIYRSDDLDMCNSLAIF